MLLPMLVISVSGSTSPQLPSRSCTAVSIPLRCSSVNPADTALPFLLTQPSTVRLPDRAPTRCSLTIGTLWTTEKRFVAPPLPPPHPGLHAVFLFSKFGGCAQPFL